MKLFSIKTAAALALLGTNKFAFAGFLKGTVEVQSDVNGSRCADPCLTAKCNSPQKPSCKPDDDGCGYSCVACNVCDTATCLVGTCVPNDDCSGRTCVSDEEEDDVKVKSDTDESEGCFSDPCPNVTCKGNKVCKAYSDCTTECVRPEDDDEEEDDVKVKSDTDESEGCFSDPCPNVTCKGNKVCKAYSDCTTECVRPEDDDEEEDDVKVKSDTDESEGCFSDPCQNVKCVGRPTRVCKAYSDCTTECVIPEEEEEEDDVKVKSDTDESEGCINDPCIGHNGKSICKGNTPFCVVDSSCNVSCQQSTTTTAATEPATPTCNICDGVNCRDNDVCQPSATCDSYKCVPADVMSNGDLKTDPLLMQE